MLLQIIRKKMKENREQMGVGGRKENPDRQEQESQRVSDDDDIISTLGEVQSQSEQKGLPSIPQLTPLPLTKTHT